MPVQHRILSATDSPGPDVPVVVEKTLIGAPAGWPSVTEQVFVKGANLMNWLRHDIVALYTKQCAALEDVVEFASEPFTVATEVPVEGENAPADAAASPTT